MNTHCSVCFAELAIRDGCSGDTHCPACMRLLDVAAEALDYRDGSEKVSFFQRDQDHVTLSISAHLISWPQCCCCCLGPAQAVYSVSRLEPHGAKTWEIPICAQCQKHIGFASIHSDGVIVASFCGLVAFLLLLSMSDEDLWQLRIAFFFLLLVFALGGMVAAISTNEPSKAAMTGWCVSATDPVYYVGSQHTVHTFLFANAKFAQLVQEANRGAIVN